MKKLFYTLCTILLCMLCIMPVRSATVSADTGPKPSVHVQFEGVKEKVYYATLLSKTRSTGPWGIWYGEDRLALESYLKEGQSEEVFMKFVEYADADGYFFLQNLFTITKDKGLSWGYYPPNTFKLLIYDPQTDSFACSSVYEKYAFDSYYKVDVSKVSFTQGEGENGSPQLVKNPIQAVQEYDWGKEIVGFLCRVSLTLAIEIALAFVFKLGRKGCLSLIVATNVGTQSLLNVFFNVFTYFGGFLCLPVYFLAEAVVFALEAGVYCLCAAKIQGMAERKKKTLVSYALAANAASFFIGVILSMIAGTDLLF